MNQGSKRHLGRELLLDLESKLADMLGRHVGEERAAAVAREATLAVATDWAGQMLYIPNSMAKDAARAARNGKIYAEFTGDNHADLARRFGLSVHAVYRIIAAERDRRMPKQCNLLGDDA